MESTRAATRRITANDFFAALFAGLKLRGKDVVPLRVQSFEAAAASVFTLLRAKATAEGIDLRFRIWPHSLHGDSPTVRDSIYNAAQRNLISLDNPEFQSIRLRVSVGDARELLRRSPLPERLVLELTDKLIADLRL